ncbi:hypothetical protein FDP41_003427 [Naegleria fowleri]|uniref:Uncharacterized protein n=1 Tax=Naegleria fowleri TaxID=5763 RepID=A0A6A5BVQ6_NAEFO|nr:uncharacterized protein FDP41_003427 [Naegleria fowleri]KAF0977435.1 hypothetical protein FDP41_003427 [Naegleria fowleri]CAG4713356.1 unnamed protein product [Naegleria fowleri]
MINPKTTIISETNDESRTNDSNNNNNNQRPSATAITPESAFLVATNLGLLAYNYNKGFAQNINNMWTGLTSFISNRGSDTIKQIASGAEPSATEVFITNKENLVAKAEAVKYLLEKRMGLFFSWKNICTVTKWALVVASSAQTVKLLYELWIYEDIFHHSAEQLAGFKRDQTEIHKKLDEMISILEHMSNLIITQERFTQTTSNSQSLVLLVEKSLLNDSFDKNFLSLTKKFKKLQESVQTEIEKLNDQMNSLKSQIQKDSDFFSGSVERSKTNMFVGASCFALSTISTLIFPPLAPVVFAGHAGGIISGAVAGINYALYYYSNSKKEKAEYRLKEVIKLQHQISHIRNQSMEHLNLYEEQKAKLVEHLKKLREQERTKRSKMEAISPAITDGGQTVDTMPDEPIINQLLLQLIEFYNINNLLFWYRVMSGIMFSLWLTSLLKDGFSITHKTLITLILYCSIMFTLNMAYDLTEKQQITFDIHVNASSHLAKVTKTAYEERYKHECIWYELPVSKQFELEIKSLFLRLIPGYGDQASQLLARNATGHLIHNSRCLHYIQVLESQDEKVVSHLIQTSSHSSSGIDVQQINNPSEMAGGTYLDFAYSIVMKSFKAIVDGLELFSTKTSFITKIWCLAVIALVLLVMVKKIVFCC